jgi:hypothetical protein
VKHRLQPDGGAWADNSIYPATNRYDETSGLIYARQGFIPTRPGKNLSTVSESQIPAGLLAERRGDKAFYDDPEARARIERIAMQAVMDAEKALGHAVEDVSKKKLGWWDITSQPPSGIDGKLPLERHIEVKGRVKGSTTVTVQRKKFFMGSIRETNSFSLLF